jgi:hypothetical protein
MNSMVGVLHGPKGKNRKPLVVVCLWFEVPHHTALLRSALWRSLLLSLSLCFFTARAAIFGQAEILRISNFNPTNKVSALCSYVL